MAKGKHIGGCIYIHKDFADQVWGDLAWEMSNLPEGFEYTLIKIDKTTGAVTFIQCDDFDTADEPTMGDAVLCYPSGGHRYMKANKDPWIYHHKWMMVDRDYEGFDVEKSRLRSEAINSLTDLDRSRIGKKSYGEEHVLPLLRSI